MRFVFSKDVFWVQFEVACVVFQKAALVDLRQIETKLILFDVAEEITAYFCRLGCLP